jgi:hypothetical protein
MKQNHLFTDCSLSHIYPYAWTRTTVINSLKGCRIVIVLIIVLIDESRDSVETAWHLERRSVHALVKKKNLAADLCTPAPYIKYLSPITRSGSICWLSFDHSDYSCKTIKGPFKAAQSMFPF